MANEMAGVKFLLEVDKGSSDFELLAGLTSCSFTQAMAEIDVTNYGSNQNKEVLDGAGVKSFGCAFSGVLKDDDSLDYLQNRVSDQALFTVRLRNTNTSGKTYQGSVKLTQFDFSASHDAALTFSGQLVFSGAITIS